MSTLYDIKLGITYLYASPAADLRAVLRMQPKNQPGQKLISGLLSADPRPDYRTDDVDFFGNVISELSYDRPVREVRFRFEGRVQRSVDPSELDLSCRYADLADDIRTTLDLGPLAPHHFVGRSDRVRPVPDITAFAEQVLVPEGSVLAQVRALSKAVHAHMTFDADATEVATDPADAFRDGRGVCQDFTHIMIAGLRGLGIPAGYVSGFLRTYPPQGEDRLEGADATHAWVQAWCGAEMGWVQIDPTNDILVGEDHVVVAVGRDYSDVAPVKGAIRASGRHTSRQEVDVLPLGG